MISVYIGNDVCVSDSAVTCSTHSVHGTQYSHLAYLLTWWCLYVGDAGCTWLYLCWVCLSVLLWTWLL